MTILIKQATVVSSGSEFNNKVVDILIEAGVISEIKKTIPVASNYKVIEANNLFISTGWIDLQVVSCDPGFEHRESLETLINSAAAGGFTSVCVHNCNQPALDSKSQIEYIVNKTQNKVVNVLPFGTITIDAKGKELAEMFDMKQSGALAFSDHKQPINDAGTLIRSLQYATNIDSLIITHCSDKTISQNWQMNEGITSTSLGLKGLPALAEEIMLQSHLSILEYTDSKIHIPTISTKGSLELIKKAKVNGLRVTCGVSSINLLLDDSVLNEFDTNYKLNPPLRTKKDVQALRQGVTSGIIDVIVSDHMPHDRESKELEFDLADFGIINLQTSFSCALEALQPKNIEAIIFSFTDNPRKILGLNKVIIAEGEAANLTLFSLEQETVLSKKNNQSKSINSPFFDKPLKGKVIGIINGAKSFFN